MNLDEIRRQIDSTDSDIIELLAKRAGLVSAAGKLKTHEKGVRDPKRVEQVIEKVKTKASAAGLQPKIAEEIYRTIIGCFVREEIREFAERVNSALGNHADFHKYHALGNDYIVIDPQKTRIDLSPETIRLICHRNFGIGSDGILYGPIFENNAIGLRIFNPDGSEAEKSGNGIRIFSRYLVDAGYVRANRFELVTKGGSVGVEVLDAKAGLITVDMGTVTFQSDRIPMTGAVREVVDEQLELDGAIYRVTCVSIGNPHCVIPVQAPSPELARTLGPLVENHPMFLNRINLQLLEVIDRNNIRIEIWERGAGYTLASGSSSCAAASAAFRLGLVDGNVDVHMPGGIISIKISADGHVHMTGPVEGIAAGAFLHDMRSLIHASEEQDSRFRER